MAVKGAGKVKANTKKLIADMQRKAVTAADIIGKTIGSRSDLYVPVDTRALINSRYVVTTATDNGARVTIGYTQPYGVFLHQSSNWKPRPIGTKVYDQGKGNPPRIKNDANMDATARWLYRGVEETKGIQQDIIKDIFKI